MSLEMESKWREEFENLDVSEFGHFHSAFKTQGGFQKVYDEGFWAIYLAARKKAQEEIDDRVSREECQNEYRLRDGFREAIEKRDKLLEQIKPRLDDALDYVGDQCHYDHHGFCQEHRLEVREDCYVYKIKQWLKQYNELMGEEIGNEF